MANIDVCTKVREYPDKDRPYETIAVRNHWNYRDRCVLEIGGKSYTVLADDLRRAIDNATNQR